MLGSQVAEPIERGAGRPRLHVADARADDFRRLVDGSLTVRTGWRA
jgi:hypothetical protein